MDWAFGGCQVHDNEMPRALAQHFDVPVEKAPVVLTGGNYMVNTEGGGMCVDKVYEDNNKSLAEKNGFKPFNDWAEKDIKTQVQRVMREH